MCVLGSVTGDSCGEGSYFKLRRASWVSSVKRFSLCRACSELVSHGWGIAALSVEVPSIDSIADGVAHWHMQVGHGSAVVIHVL